MLKQVIAQLKQPRKKIWLYLATSRKYLSCQFAVALFFYLTSFLQLILHAVSAEVIATCYTQIASYRCHFYHVKTNQATVTETVAIIVAGKEVMATYRLQLPRSLLESATNQTASSYDNQNFDSNMVIVLVALVCALMLILGINSFVRCFMRCTQMYEAEDEEIPHLSSTRRKNDVFREIPMVVYRSGLHTPATECPICLGEFAEGENVRILPRCNHGFHVQCIDRWLLVHSSCPTCRQQLPEAPATIGRYNGPLTNLLLLGDQFLV